MEAAHIEPDDHGDVDIISGRITHSKPHKRYSHGQISLSGDLEVLVSRQVTDTEFRTRLEIQESGQP